MKLRRSVFAWLVVSLAVLACSSSSATSSNCCVVGTGNQGVPSCLCGTQMEDGGPCSVTSSVGATCTVSCNGQTAGGQSATSCSGQ